MLVRGRRIALCIKQKSKEMCHTGVLFWNPSYKTHASLFKAGLALYSEQAGRCLMGCRRHPVPMSKKNSIEALTSSYIAISSPLLEALKRVKGSRIFKSLPHGRRGPASWTSLPSSCFMLAPVAGALTRPEQLARNAAHSGTSGG
jgi:hypothetical protein